MSETIALDKIDRAAGTQSRAGLHGPTVYDYSEAMEAGDKFPPIELIYDGEAYYLKDGFHRVAAAIQAGFTTIDANVEQGTLEDAQWASYAVNATHGLRRSREDTRRAIVAALKHPNGVGKSNGVIGRHVGVDPKTVATVREQLQLSREIPEMASRQVERNGQTYSQNTANIGATKQSLEERFPLNCYVYLKNCRLRRVRGYQNNHLIVADPMLPSSQALQELMVDKTLRLATEKEIDAYCFPPFPVGSKVVVEGSATVNTVVDTMIGYVTLQSPESKQTYTVQVTSVRRASDQAPPADDEPIEFVNGDGTPLTQEDIEQRNEDVLAALGLGDDDGPDDNGTLDGYRESDELPLPPAPYRVSKALGGSIGIFDAEGHVFLYFVGLSEEAEKQIGEYLVNTLNSVMSARVE